MHLSNFEIMLCFDTESSFRFSDKGILSFGISPFSGIECRIKNIFFIFISFDRIFYSVIIDSVVTE